MIDERTQTRFWPELGQCWEWTACRDSFGHGQLRIGKGRGRTIQAHRLSWIIDGRGDPGSLCVLHRCDLARCVRPDHLFLGTRTDNAADKVRKGRQARGEILSVKRRGERHAMAKLSEPDVHEIRRLCASGETQRSVAARFGVTQTTVGYIVLRKSWSHI